MDQEMSFPEPEEQNESTYGKSQPCGMCEEYLEGWKRAQADYQNLQKEVERERGQMIKFANERLWMELLPALDQMTIALREIPDVGSLPEDARKHWENWLVGVKAVQFLWEQTAKNLGLERVPVDISFDPSLHEAVGEEGSDMHASGDVLRVVQDGWRLHGKLLRPASVIVAT